MIPSGRNAETVISAGNLRMQVEFLTDSTFKGRATGSIGATETAFWIARHYEKAGLIPFDGSWSRSFKVEGLVGRNMIGFLPGRKGSGKETYVIKIGRAHV